MAPSRAQIMQDDPSRRKEQRIDAVKIVLVACKNLGKGSAMIGRSRGRHFGADFCQLLVIGADPQHSLAAIEDSVVRAANGCEKVGSGGRQRCCAVTRYDLSEIKF